MGPRSSYFSFHGRWEGMRRGWTHGPYQEQGVVFLLLSYCPALQIPGPILLRECEAVSWGKGIKWHWNLLSKFTAVWLNADFHNPVGVCWLSTAPHSHLHGCIPPWVRNSQETSTVFSGKKLERKKCLQHLEMNFFRIILPSSWVSGVWGDAQASWCFCTLEPQSQELCKKKIRKLHNAFLGALTVWTGTAQISVINSS